MIRSRLEPRRHPPERPSEHDLHHGCVDFGLVHGLGSVLSDGLRFPARRSVGTLPCWGGILLMSLRKRTDSKPLEIKLPALRSQNEDRMTRGHHPLTLAVLLMLAGGSASAQGYSLLSGSGLFSSRPPLIDQAPLDPQPLIRAHAEIPDTAEAEEARGRAQSLFIGRSSGGLFAPFAPRDRDPSGSIADAYGPIHGNDPHAEMIRHVIAHAEAGAAGYDAVQYGAKRKPAGAPTQMTLGEIFAWIKATPGQPHAIGRYQFIPSTLARLVEIAGASPQERFSPEMQDRLADILLQEAGLDAYRSGRMSQRSFMNNLAKIWAGLPNSSGRSHYDGYAGNSATMTWDRFESEMTRIFRS
jgi:muramidase (phage lysozyme)